MVPLVNEDGPAVEMERKVLKGWLLLMEGSRRERRKVD